jgi:hypothetical protein
LIFIANLLGFDVFDWSTVGSVCLIVKEQKLREAGVSYLFIESMATEFKTSSMDKEGKERKETKESKEAKSLGLLFLMFSSRLFSSCWCSSVS